VAGDLVTCPNCRASTEVATGFRGGLINCQRCGKVIEVAGLRDPLWWLLRTGATLAIGAATVLAVEHFGIARGMLSGAALATIAWLLSRGL
jgi:hypothetical protein